MCSSKSLLMTTCECERKPLLSVKSSIFKKPFLQVGNLKVDKIDSNFEVTAGHNIKFKSKVDDMEWDSNEGILTIYGILQADLIQSIEESDLHLESKRNLNFITDFGSINSNVYNGAYNVVIINDGYRIYLENQNSKIIIKKDEIILTSSKIKFESLETEWIPATRFIAGSDWNIQRNVNIDNYPFYFLTKTASMNETAFLHFNIDSSHKQTLESVTIVYDIVSANLVSITARLILNEFTNQLHYSNISIDTSHLNIGTAITQHIRTIPLTTPTFVNIGSFLCFEIEINMLLNSQFVLHGLELSFT